LDQLEQFNELCERIMRYQRDPLGFVLAIYPWGEGELANATGPRQWHIDALTDIGVRLRRGYEPGQALMPVLKSIASGHGCGKTALHSWIGWWALSTCPHTKVRTTANTATQLKSTSVPEAAKWAALALNKDWFRADGMQIVAADPRYRLTWRWDFVTWSPTNTEAFAGLHNKGRRVVMLFDEASGIPPKVWAPAEGILTDEATEIIWLVTGNPTQPEGRFFECFGKERARWHGVQIDSRMVEGTNKALLDEWIASYGEDSDFSRVRVRGIFPRAGVRQFISRELADNAAANEPIPLASDPLLIGVDVARSGNAQSVIAIRKGRDARSWPWKKFRGIDTMQLASVVAETARELSADMVFVDEGGMGAGVVDRLRQLNINVAGVQFGGKASRTAVGGNPSLARVKYANKRAEIWGFMREWLEGGAIPQDEELLSDLAGPQYGFNARDEIQLERKEDMEKRGLASPDVADALATTFAEPVEPARDGRMGVAGLHDQRVVSEYDPFAVMG
jgi:hypothetical protein